ncbi:O-antigen ligase family protein [Rhodococcus sp. NBC_00294]|uniref:O-antigen ligase family protein n=1 Tax=Rhodococcus sp. NBC_00294 TaxID=2976004 RepID=UPI002E29DD66|nr:O-antigen ligase family protein [Rhodococcus sp. NBC_00294]
MVSSTAPPGRRAGSESSVGAIPLLLRIIVVAALVLPANMVFAPIGAVGYAAMLVAIAMFVVWAAAVVWRAHDPIPHRHPARIGLAALWLSSVLSYIRMSDVDEVQRASADRWILTMFAITALIAVTAETVRTLDHAMTLSRTFVRAATVCAAVALYQFVMKTDPLDHVRTLMVGMTDNGGATTFQARGLLTRVAGNTFTPIELGLVLAMVLPLAVWRALHDPSGRAWVHWTQCGAIAFASVITVSRSAILGLVVGAIVTVPFLPRFARRWSAIAIPFVVVVLFVSVPGLIATLRATLFADAESDPSLLTRVNNYPRIQAMIERHPFFGSGPATYMPTNALQILDNEYLNSAIELGLIGVVALMLFMLTPVVAAVGVAFWSSEPSLRLLAASVGAACAVAAVGSAVFDSLSFPVFTIVFPIFVGLSGAVWMIARNTAPRGSAAPS